ncbi:MAG TPA: tRNA dihydrouridine synthase DusB, partial [Microterricola sp.]
EFFEDEDRGCRDVRKHVAWYFKGYPVGGELRARMATVESLQSLDDLLGTLDWDQPYPGEGAEGPRGRAGTPKTPSLPDKWLESRDIDGVQRSNLTEGEGDTSGG